MAAQIVFFTETSRARESVTLSASWRVRSAGNERCGLVDLYGSKNVRILAPELASQSETARLRVPVSLLFCETIRPRVISNLGCVLLFFRH